MTPDPVQFSVTTGYQAIPMPGNGLDAITNEALDLHASHAILDAEHLPGSLTEVTARLHPVQIETVPGRRFFCLSFPGAQTAVVPGLAEIGHRLEAGSK